MFPTKVATKASLDFSNLALLVWNKRNVRVCQCMMLKKKVEVRSLMKVLQLSVIVTFKVLELGAGRSDATRSKISDNAMLAQCFWYLTIGQTINSKENWKIIACGFMMLSWIGNSISIEAQKKAEKVEYNFYCLHLRWQEKQ
ncbi:CLUMA_CG015934, isoform A [Clunio marinus]|uniref:CLUMA_CG015934, isoform A n=1 Tax=Clunio marinus TaxID=568069 RepID=A0A1J1ISV9_9DIPT|nr:CLUMA_CG015934, isoform A [Clunio marinus]